ncbi:MAG: HAD family hydrolase [Gemmatimonadales bacterium]|nr:HAD family hydrolase [Gemmatimonadales bacterium]
MKAGVFLDRDGTIVADPGYLRDPADVVLLPGAGQAIARLNAAGRTVVVVTNQSGIARGKLSPDDFDAVTRRIEELVRGAGGHIDATYMCPHAPEVGPCECRKPGLLLYRRALRALQIDPACSWWVGDRESDLTPAPLLGGRGILVLTGEGVHHREAAEALGFGAAAGLPEAVGRILTPNAN